MRTRSTVIVLIAACLASCVSTTGPLLIEDGQALPPGTAHVVLSPVFKISGRFTFDAVDIELVRVEKDKQVPAGFFPGLKNGANNVTALPIGFYFLKSIQSAGGYYQHTIPSTATLFEVKPGQINYAGDWILTRTITGHTAAGGAMSGEAVTSFAVSFYVKNDELLARPLGRTHPKLVGSLPIAYTWINVKASQQGQSGSLAKP